MPYMVLARRWRPQTFDEVVGQSHVTRTLKNAISSGRTAHAFLFSGARGVGKTTVARVLAKALNCMEGPTPAPCGVCDSCKEITAGMSMDVQEIDGASNTSVEDVRDLREGLNYRPSKSRYRIYIIDEVHMLSNSAFNALLKTLEEPPPHVVFIFATTEPQKIPSTILSRCQRFDFKRITLGDMIEQLKKICDEEGIRTNDEAITLLAAEAQGSLRDAQSLLDQVISYSGQNVSPEDIRLVLGILDRQWLFQTSEAVIKKDAKGCLELVESIYQHGFSLTYYYQQLVEHIRNLLVTRVTDSPGTLLPLPDHEVEELARQAREVAEEDLHLWFDILVKAEGEVRRSGNPRYLMEMLLVKIATLDRTHELQSLIERIQTAGSDLKSTSYSPPESVSTPEARPVSAKAVTVTDDTETKKEDTQDAAPPVVGESQGGAISEEDWNGFLKHVKKSKPMIHSLLSQGSFLDSQGEKAVRVEFNMDFAVVQVRSEKNTQAVDELTAGFFGRPIRVIPVLNTKKKVNNNNSKKHEMEVSARTHPFVKEALSIFDGQIVEVRFRKKHSRKRRSGRNILR